MLRMVILLILLLFGCAPNWHMYDDFVYVPINTGEFDIATWQKITDTESEIHIYIEGDGHAFNGRGIPTNNPTPHSAFMRKLAVSDEWPNVVYMARPCQFIMSRTCTVTDWTTGRFSKKIIDSMSDAVRKIAGQNPIVLIGYSGGAMISGLMIQNNNDLNVQKWITIAGVLNHADWTQYFGDAKLEQSMNLYQLPEISQLHYIAENDAVVPYSLSYKWTNGQNMIVVPNASHGDFGKLQLNFEY